MEVGDKEKALLEKVKEEKAKEATDTSPLIDGIPNKNCTTCYGRGRYKVIQGGREYEPICGCVQRNAQKEAHRQGIFGKYRIKMKASQLIAVGDGKTAEIKVCPTK
jgi:hypothetical protein